MYSFMFFVGLEHAVVTQFETPHELQEDLFKRFETLDEELSIL
jgi:hypothetical protein